MTQLTYDAIMQSVFDLTRRPDLVAETALAIRKATMKAHLRDFWKSDLTRAIITLPVVTPGGDTSYRYSLDLTDVGNYPFLRKVSYIKEHSTTLTGREIQLKQLDHDRLLDSYLVEDINYWAQMAKQVEIRCSKVLNQIAVGYYRYPDITATIYDSWIAAEFPDLIVEEAVAKIFATIGKDQEAARHASYFEENIHAITMAQIEAV